MDRASLAGQHDEGRLGSILGLVPVGQHITADAQDHRCVPFNKGPERGLASIITLAQESL
jgi:hypothetical protein